MPERTRSPALLRLCFILLPCLALGQVNTIRPRRVNEDRFDVKFLFSQYNASFQNVVTREFDLYTYIGLTPKIEFVGWLPFVTVWEGPERESMSAPIGDLTGYLTFQLGKGWYRFPFLQDKKDSLFYFDMCFGWNFGTGWKFDTEDTVEEVENPFYPPMTGISDFRFGLLWGSYTPSWEYVLNVIYVYGTKTGFFEVFPLTKRIWDEESDPPSYFFNLHEGFFMLLWPGKVRGKQWRKDDYILYNICLNRWVEMPVILFRYKLMLELNGLQPFNSSECLLPPALDLTFGILINLFKGGNALIAVAHPFYPNVYDTPKFYIGTQFSL